MDHCYPKSVSIELIVKNLHDHAAKCVATESRTDIETVPLDDIRNAVAAASNNKTPLGGSMTVKIGVRPEIVVSFTCSTIETYDYDEKYGLGKTADAIRKAVYAGTNLSAHKAATACALFCMIFTGLFARCETEVVDGIEWRYIVKNNTAVIQGNRGSSSVEPAVSPSLTGTIRIPEKLGGYPVREIGIMAFQFTNSVDTIVVPSSVSIINGAALSGPYSSCVYIRATEEKYEYEVNHCVKGLLFLGEKPTISNPTYINDSGKTIIFDIGHSVLSYITVRQFSDSKCYYVYGHSSWDGVTTYCGTWQYGSGDVQNTYLGASDVTITPKSCVTTESDVEISICSIAAANNIHFTLDGTTPTASSPLYVVTFVAHPPCQIRATSIRDDLPYAIEDNSSIDRKVKNANITSTQGVVFDRSGNSITITCSDVASLRYTLDDSPVTSESPLYTEPFAISETTTVRAKAFKEDWFDSDETVQTFTRLWHTNETPVVSAEAEAFESASQEVSLSCETEDATIYYTIDGSEPSAQNGRLYKEPFDIYQTTTVKAIAVKDDWKDSAVASATFTKANAIGPAINLLEVLPDNDKDSPWTVVTDVTHDGVSAVKSGAIEDDESTTLKAVIYGAGELSFWWKASCEPSIEGEYYDYGTFYNGSTIVTNIAGVTEWQHVTLKVPGTAKHTFKWTYQKDGSGSTVPDCIWLDQVQWLPETTDYYADHTLTTEAPVKYKWLRSYGLAIEDDFEAAAKAKTGKIDGAGRVLTVEDDFVAGTDPTNLTSRFTSAITMEGGIPKITWTPDLGEEREYKVLGKASLVGGDWTYPTNSLHRLFKVSVEMPQ